MQNKRIHKFTSWFTCASEPKYQVDIADASVLVSIDQLNQIIKKKLSNSPVVLKLFEQFEVSIDRLNDLRIEVADLEDRYAETDVEKMSLNQSLFESGRFFQDYFFVVRHELVHWLSRIRESDAYFADPEETLGFVSSIAYELEQNVDLDTLYNKIYPKISWHFNDEADAREFFERMIIKAKQLMDS